MTDFEIHITYQFLGDSFILLLGRPVEKLLNGEAIGRLLWRLRTSAGHWRSWHFSFVTVQKWIRGYSAVFSYGRTLSKRA